MCGSQSDDTFHIRRSGHGRADRSILPFCITFFLCRELFDRRRSFLYGCGKRVFSILRGKHLNLRDGTASLLEIESGSNDPMSYLLTMIGISLLGKSDTGNIPLMIFMQLALGILVGVVIALIGIVLLTKTNFIPEGLETIFVIAIVIFSFGLAELIGGNSYLSVYLLGILLGNSRIRNKNILIPFFDGVTGLAQILIFFLLDCWHFRIECRTL